MTDKEAIEILKDLWRYEHSEFSEKEIREALEKGIEALENPITRCKDCQFWTKEKNSLQGRCFLENGYPTGSYFCGSAKRKENVNDRNYT